MSGFFPHNSLINKQNSALIKHVLQPQNKTNPNDFGAKLLNHVVTQSNTYPLTSVAR
jgi:hypothetical protein